MQMNRNFYLKIPLLLFPNLSRESRKNKVETWQLTGIRHLKFNVLPV